MPLASWFSNYITVFITKITFILVLILFVVYHTIVNTSNYLDIWHFQTIQKTLALIQVARHFMALGQTITQWRQEGWRSCCGGGGHCGGGASMRFFLFYQG
jgi:hypothetical protein